MYEYFVEVKKVVDGDTIDVVVDLGFGVLKKERVRLVGVNAPETNSKNPKEREAGLATKMFVAKQLGLPPAESRFAKVKIQSEKPDPADKYGRYLARVLFSYGDQLKSDSSEVWICLNDLLVTEKLAAKYDGGARPAWSESS
jgi:micrococcal nuclease